MPVTDELTAEINAGVEQVIEKPAEAETAETKNEETVKADEAKKPGSPSVETIVEHEDDAEDDGEAGVVAKLKDGEDDGGAAAKPEEKKEEQKKPTTEPAKPLISDYALTAAARAGLDLDVARQFPSEESLLRVVSRMDSAKAKEEKKVEEEDPFADLPTLDPETYEPEVIKMFDALKGVISKQQEQIKSFKTYQEETSRGGQEVAAREIHQWFDGQVAKLGEDFHESLGSGEMKVVPQGSPQYAKREAIANQVAIVLAGYRAVGAEPPPRDEVFDAAARLVLKDEYQKQYEKKLSGDLAKRSTQHIQRAGGNQKNKTTQSPLDETAALLDEKYFGKKK